MKIKTQAKYLAALLPFIYEEENRYYLNGIHVKPYDGGGILLASTDGHTLGCIHDADGETDAEYILNIPKKGLMANALRHFFRREEYTDEDGEKSLRQCQDASTVIIDGEIATLNDTFGTPLEKIVVSVIDGTYPDYRAIFRKTEFGGAHDFFAFNPDLLQKFSETACILKGSAVAYLKCYFSTAGKNEKGSFDTPFLVTISVPNFYGAIMPVMVHNSSFPSHVLPEWALKP